MSNALMLDRYRIIKKYREAGLTEDQAELYTEALVIAVEDQVATKQDVHAVRNELREEIHVVRSELREVETSLRQEIAEVKSELKQDIAGLRIIIVEENRKTLFLTIGLLGGLMALFRFFS